MQQFLNARLGAPHQRMHRLRSIGALIGMPVKKLVGRAAEGEAQLLDLLVIEAAALLSQHVCDNRGIETKALQEGSRPAYAFFGTDAANVELEHQEMALEHKYKALPQQKIAQQQQKTAELPIEIAQPLKENAKPHTKKAAPQYYNA